MKYWRRRDSCPYHRWLVPAVFLSTMGDFLRKIRDNWIDGRYSLTRKLGECDTERMLGLSSKQVQSLSPLPKNAASAVPDQSYSAIVIARSADVTPSAPPSATTTWRTTSVYICVYLLPPFLVIETRLG